MNDIFATSLSEVLAQNYIKEVAGSALKCILLGGVGYVSVKLLNEHLLRNNKK
jgi:hypothetical protein